MNTLVQRVADLAQSTFSESVHNALFPGRYLELLNTVNQLRDTDLNVVNPGNILQDFNARTRYVTTVLEIVIAENEVLTMRVFILRNGLKIPVHDHPNMHVILKMVSGFAEVTSYSLADEYLNDPGIPAYARVIRPQNRLKQVDIYRSGYVASYHMPVVLTPTEGNFYEIRADGGAAAFFEIVAPSNDIVHRSYNMFQRSWKFYNVTETITYNYQRKFWLSVLPYRPDKFWGRPRYTGPRVVL